MPGFPKQEPQIMALVNVRFAGVLYGWRNGIWDVMRSNINNVRECKL